MADALHDLCALIMGSGKDFGGFRQASRDFALQPVPAHEYPGFGITTADMPPSPTQ